ncbi:peroxisomal membrane protein PEX14-like [Dysidea avara]|uniref:peroxisomal membrane protein PEX14-like n=1 Tax=Dysidea avara TaxID=196820 RepID=UPI003322C06B
MADGDNLVNVAVKFLSNPKVKETPISAKKAFLKKKGLTDEQIDEAIRLAGVQPILSATEVTTTTQTSYTRSILSLMWRASIVCGVTYVTAYLFKWYVLPWLRGNDQQLVQQLSEVTSSLSELNNNLSQSLTKLSESNAALQQSLLEQHNRLESLSIQFTSLQASGGHSSLNDIKSELTSLKGLLLNRNQFASPGKPEIPQWQRTSTEHTQATSNDVQEGVKDSVEESSN